MGLRRLGGGRGQRHKQAGRGHHEGQGTGHVGTEAGLKEDTREG